MNCFLKVLGLLLLLSAVMIGPTGCASTQQTSDTVAPITSDSTPSKDDESHGWGAGVQGTSH